MIKNEKVALDRLRVRQNAFLVLSVAVQRVNAVLHDADQYTVTQISTHSRDQTLSYLLQFLNSDGNMTAYSKNAFNV